MWEAPPPRWLDLERGDLWGTIAIQDHGAAPFVYEELRKVPLGANMAARRALFDARRRLPRRPRTDQRQAACSDRKCRNCCCARAPPACAACMCRRCGCTTTSRSSRLTPPVLPALVVRQGGVARRARADAAGDGTGRGPADDAAPARRAALHVRDRRLRDAAACCETVSPGRGQVVPPRDDAAYSPATSGRAGASAARARARAELDRARRSGQRTSNVVSTGR